MLNQYCNCDGNTESEAYQHWTVLLLENSHLVDVLAHVNSLNNVSKLSVNVWGTPDTLQGPSGLLNLAAGNKTVGGVGNDDGSQEEDEGRHNGQTHGQTPAMGVHVLGAVVDPLGNPDTDSGGHLEHDVQSATGVSRGNLRQVQRHSLQGNKYKSAMSN